MLLALVINGMESRELSVLIVSSTVTDVSSTVTEFI